MSEKLKKVITKESTADSVQKRIDDCIKKKKNDLDAIMQKCEELSSKITDLDDTLKEAEAEMDSQKYASTMAEKEILITTLNMYHSRENTLQGKEFLSEEESDEVIDSLLDYEKKLSESLEEDSYPHIIKLIEILDSYYAEVYKTEKVIRQWTRYIHANYINRHNHRRRSDHSIPVSTIPYDGSSFALRLRSFLNKESDYIKERSSDDEES